MTSIIIPDSVNSIGTYAFYNCTSLASVTLSENLTSIGSYAFQNCSSLSEITIPAGVTTIPTYAFYGCSSLTNVVIPSGVTSIGNYAFYNCSSLATVTIPGSVTSIGNYAFYGCGSLTDVYYAYSEYDWKNNISFGSNNDGLTSDIVTIHYNCEITFTWAEDYSSCTATYIKNGEPQTVDCIVTSSNTAVSCTEDGKIVYTASFTITNSDEVESTYTDTKEFITAQATGHTYGDPTFSWNDDHTACTAIFTCTEGDDTQSVECDEITSDTTAATCTEEGSIVYTTTCTFNGTEYIGTDTVTIPATGHTVESDDRVEPTCTEDGHESGTYCSVCGEILSGYTVLPATGHSYDTYAYSWSNNFASCTFTFTCSSCGDVRTETDSTVTKTVTDATCTEAGSEKYVAFVSFEGETYTVTSTTEVKATGHTYGDPVFTWADDYSDCAAEFTCDVCGHTETVNCDVTSKTTTATCEADGQTVYTATVEFNGTTYSDTQTVVIEKTGHSYPLAAFTWAEDYSSATAILTCTWCGNIVELDCTVESVITAATCTEDGQIVYTAKAVYGGTTYNEAKTVVLPATGHTYGEPTFTWSEDYSECTAVFTCTQGDDTQTVNCTVTSEVIEAATCTENGTMKYTATVTFEGETYTDTKTVVTQATGHTYESVVTEPTCTKEGHTTYICKECGDSYIDNYTDALGHSYEAIVTEATCTEGGYITYTCSVCGESYKDDYTAALGHSYSTVVTEATCTEQGYTTHTCERCGESYTDSYTDALGHSWDEGVITREASETESGIITYTCKVCGATYTEDIPATGHEHSYETVVTEPTCTEQGYTTYTCTGCGESYVSDYVDAIGHKYETDVTEPTCTEQGYTTYTCTVCGYSYVGDYTEATGHTYEAKVTEPTCTERGYTTYTCTVCGDSYIGDYTEALGHTYEKVVTEPTCIEQGYTTYTCTVCGDSYVGDYTEATGHTYEKVVTEPTCTEEGYTTYTCADCGDTYISDYVEASGHTWDDGVITKEATETETGVMTYTCTVCGETKTEEIPVLVHTHTYEVTFDWATDGTCTVTLRCATCEEVIETQIITVDDMAVENRIEPTCTAEGYVTYKVYVTFEETGDTQYTDTCSILIPATGHNYEATITEPTCSEQGYTTYTCSICGDSYKDDYVDTLQHSYVAIVTEPTCSEQGYTTYTCSVCGDSYVDDYTDPLDHTYTTVVTDPTCEKEGYTTYTCTVCGYSYIGDYTDALGHDYVETAHTDADCSHYESTTYTCTTCGDTFTVYGLEYGDHDWDGDTCTICGTTQTTEVVNPIPMPVFPHCPWLPLVHKVVEHISNCLHHFFW